MEDQELIDAVETGLRRIADSITPIAAAPAPDANGGYVGSLTEAAMGISAGLAKIADSISDLAQAIREENQ